MSLTPRQNIIVVAAGIILWFAAALCVQYLGPWLFDFGLKHALFYVLLIPITWPFVVAIEKIAGLTKETLFLGIGIGTATALFLDGLAFAWFPSLYGLSAEIRLAGAASILWGAGVFLAIACWRGRG
jgi:hypothetical protein